MTKFTWTAAGSGSYEDYTAWNAWQVGNPPLFPNTSNEVVLPSHASAYSVQAFNGDGAASVATAASATLTLGGSFTIAHQVTTDINAGSIADPSQTLHFAGAMDNTGSISLQTGATLVFDGLASLGATFSGGGQIILGGFSGDSVYATNGATVTNVDNKISGAGTIGTGHSFKLVNQSAGVIDQTSANSLVLNVAGAGVSNTGEIESTGTGGLTILSTTVDDSGSSNAGSIQANGAGSGVYLQSAHIIGGSLSTSGGGVIQTADSGSVIDSSGGAITDSATINVVNNMSLTVGGQIANSGTINLQSIGNGTALQIDANNLTLSGAGKVALSDNSQNYIYGVSTGSVLTNVDNTISGAGQLGNGKLTMVNKTAGVINGTSAVNALNVNMSGGLTNQGLIEGTGATGTVIASTLVTNTGTVEATGGGALKVLSSTIHGSGTTEALGAGSHLYLQSATLTNGVVATDVNGVIETLDGGNTIDNATVNNAGLVQIDNNTQLTLGSTVNNTGTIALNSVGNGTFLRIDNNNATLQGGGKLTLGDNSQNYVYGVSSGSVLTNVDNTISGAGQLGNGALTMVNKAAGVIDGTSAANALNVNVSGGLNNQGLIEGTGATGTVISSTQVRNTGTIEATGGGALKVLASTVRGAGTVEALGVGSHLYLQSATINSGTVASDANGVIETLDGGSSIDNAAVTNAGTLQIDNNTELTLGSKVTNTGTIALNSVGNGTLLRIDSNGATLSGGGKVTLSDNSQNYIIGQSAADSLTNVDNTISGSGQLGNGGLTLNNQAAGVIDSTGAGNALVLNTGAPIANAGLIEDTGKAGLQINSDVIKQATTGVIEAAGAGSHVDLASAQIVGGKITATGGGVIQTMDGGTLFDALTVSSATTVTVNNNTALNILGTIHNSGTIALQSAGNGTEIVVSSLGAALTGGKVTLTDNAQNYITGPGGAALTTTANITGSGQITNLALTLSTKGVIDGTGVNGIVISTNKGVVNLGTMEGTTAGGLTINSTLVNNSTTIEATKGGRVAINSSTIAGQTGGVGLVEAIGVGAHLDLASATLTNGALKTDVNGTINVLDSGSVIDNDAVTNVGTININNNDTLTAGGTITNSGTINLKSVGNGTALQIDNNDLTLSGGGKVILTNNAQNYIVGQAGGDTFTNVDNTISGSGQFGNGHLTFVNGAAGTVNANGSVGLTIDTGSGGLTNQGLIEATAGGAGLISSSVVSNTGVIKAAGGTLEIASSAVSGAGTVEALGSGSTLQLASSSITGGVFATDANGVIQTLDTGSSVDNVAVTNAGAIDILNNTALTLGSTVTNTGTIALQSGGNGTELIIDSNGATLQGGGKVTLSDNSQNYLTGQVIGDTLTNVNNTISGAGQIGDGHLTLVNNAAGVIDATDTDNALVINTGGPTVANAGTLEAASGATLSVQAAVANTGTIAANGGTVTVAGAVTGAGAANIAAGGQIEFQAASSAAVTFTGSTGKLILDASQQFTGSITGMTVANPGDVVDLTDINFAGATESYVGTATSGVLTVSDGTHTANLNMVGNYVLANFTFSNDGAGHVQFHDPAVATMVNAMASLPDSGGGSGSSPPVTTSSTSQTQVLAPPAV